MGRNRGKLKRVYRNLRCDDSHKSDKRDASFDELPEVWRGA